MVSMDNWLSETDRDREATLSGCENRPAWPPDPHLSSIICDINDSRSNRVSLFIRQSGEEKKGSSGWSVGEPVWSILLCGF